MEDEQKIKKKTPEEKLIDEFKKMDCLMDESTAKKVALIERGLEEITTQDKISLRTLIKEKTLKIYWGTAITGKPHVAYLIPCMKIRDFIKAGCEVKILLADIHGFLDNLKATPEQITKRYFYYEKLLKTIFKNLLGKDSDRLTFVKGSDIELRKEYFFDLLKLSSLTSERDVKRAGADVVKQSKNPLLSSMIYPNMQALDEEYLDVDIQFGGSDQRKIFMHAKTFLPKLGYKKRIHLMSPMMPGLNSDKMSSSDEKSKIDLLDTKEKISKKLRKVFCSEGNIETNNVLTIFKSLLFPYFDGEEIFGVETFPQLEQKFKDLKIHPCDLKLTCVDLLDKIIKPIRDIMREDPSVIEEAYN